MILESDSFIDGDIIRFNRFVVLLDLLFFFLQLDDETFVL